MAYKYIETRSKRAIAIDRAKNARLRYSKFNPKYAHSPNKSDVEGYDTKAGKGVYVPPPKQEQQHTKDKEYVPTEQEKARLLTYFYQMSPIEQHKDLLVTKNVIRKESDVDKWKRNPKYYDIRDIDTRPKELVTERLNVATKFAGNPNIQIKKFNWVRQQGQYKYNPQMTTNKGTIKIDEKTQKEGTFNRVLSHELGHAYDRNVINVMTSDTHRLRRNSGNINFGNIKKPKMLSTVQSYSEDRTSFGKVNKAILKIDEQRQKSRKKVVRITERKINPYNPKKATFKYTLYRRRDTELFADWFSGLVTKKNVVKRESRGFYNTFKKANKPFFRAMRQSDFNVTKKYIGGKNAKKFSIF